MSSPDPESSDDEGGEVVQRPKWRLAPRGETAAERVKYWERQLELFDEERRRLNKALNSLPEKWDNAKLLGGAEARAKKAEVDAESNDLLFRRAKVGEEMEYIKSALLDADIEAAKEKLYADWVAFVKSEEEKWINANDPRKKERDDRLKELKLILADKQHEIDLLEDAESDANRQLRWIPENMDLQAKWRELGRRYRVSLKQYNDVVAEYKKLEASEPEKPSEFFYEMSPPDFLVKQIPKDFSREDFSEAWKLVKDKRDLERLKKKLEEENPAKERIRQKQLEEDRIAKSLQMQRESRERAEREEKHADEELITEAIASRVMEITGQTPEFVTMVLRGAVALYSDKALKSYAPMLKQFDWYGRKMRLSGMARKIPTNKAFKYSSHFQEDDNWAYVVRLTESGNAWGNLSVFVSDGFCYLFGGVAKLTGENKEQVECYLEIGKNGELTDIVLPVPVDREFFIPRGNLQQAKEQSRANDAKGRRKKDGIDDSDEAILARFDEKENIIPLRDGSFMIGQEGDILQINFYRKPYIRSKGGKGKKDEKGERLHVSSVQIGRVFEYGDDLFYDALDILDGRMTPEAKKYREIKERYEMMEQAALGGPQKLVTSKSKRRMRWNKME